MKLKYILIFTCLLLLFNCKNEKKDNTTLQVVTTTTMITDLVKTIGGNAINVQGLMGSGVDPHLFKASEGDVNKLANADVVFYNGLHLEGKLVEVLKKMQNKKTVALAEILDKQTLIGSNYFKSNFDPHVWFNITYWKTITNYVVDVLSKEKPELANTFKVNGAKYIVQLTALEQEVNKTINQLAVENRILVTAHDAFNYFGKNYNFEVVGLQGLSTATEAGVQDVQKLANFIINKQIKAIFVESSVPKRTIEALQEAVKAKGHEVTIGGTLYSDALGNAGTVEGTYLGMFRHNVNTIVNALR